MKLFEQQIEEHERPMPGGVDMPVGHRYQRRGMGGRFDFPLTSLNGFAKRFKEKVLWQVNSLSSVDCSRLQFSL